MLAIPVHGNLYSIKIFHFGIGNSQHQHVADSVDTFLPQLGQRMILGRFADLSAGPVDAPSGKSLIRASMLDTI
jgi:hypothetical protein